MIDNKIANKITKGFFRIFQNSQQNNSETVTNEDENTELDRKIPRKRYISPEKRQQIINEPRLIC